MDALVINSELTIPAQYLSADAARSGGPGGQHVNKTSTKVILTFDLEGCPLLDSEVKERLLKLIGKRTDKDGQPVITCQETRYRERNLEKARNKLADIIRQALVVPVERKETKPTKVAEEKRLETKRRRSQKKELRRKVELE